MQIQELNYRFGTSWSERGEWNKRTNSNKKLCSMFMLIKRLYIQVFKKEREFIIIFYDGTKSHRSILLLLMFICVNDYICTCLLCFEIGFICCRTIISCRWFRACVVCRRGWCHVWVIRRSCAVVSCMSRSPFVCRVLFNVIASDCPWAVSLVVLCVVSKVQLFICVLISKRTKGEKK